MLTISDVTKSFAGRTLFDEVSLQVNRQDRIGLVGPNGAGKSTLFSLILRTEETDRGNIILEKNVSVGYLPQESAPVRNETVLELSTATTVQVSNLEKKLEAHEETQMSSDASGTARLEARAKTTLSGLGFRQADFDRPAREMSGGWVMRAHLARLLVHEPDLLMLDEPTNHLDLEA